MKKWLPALLVLSLFLIWFCAGVGEGGWSNPLAADPVLMEIRLPRIFVALLVGAALSASGAALQALFENPLADPSLIGTSGGAAMGVVLAIAMGWSIAVPLAAFAGAFAVCILILLGHRLVGGGKLGLLVMGFVVSALCGALVSLILFLSDDMALRSAMTWLSGSFSEAGFVSPAYAGGVMLAGLVVLAAVGRRPNTDNIGLENLNIELDERGVPKAHPLTMQTSIPHIFIAGDASNQLPLLHEASDQGKIAGDNAGRYPNIANGLRRSTIGVVFTNPQIASVGLRYAQVRQRYKNPECVAIGEVSFRNQGRSRVMLVNKGHMRVYAEQGSGRFIGAEIFGPAAEHLAHLLAWAHQASMTVPQMLDMPFYHPVIEEGLRTALRDVMAKLKIGGEMHSECKECVGD